MTRRRVADGRITYVVRNSDLLAFALALHGFERLEVELDARHVGIHLQRLADPLDRLLVVIHPVVDLPEAGEGAEVARVALEDLAAVGDRALEIADEVIDGGTLVPPFGEVALAARHLAESRG